MNLENAKKKPGSDVKSCRAVSLHRMLYGDEGVESQ